MHPRSIELGLERVHAVLDRLALRAPNFRAITVAGTNGKGSTVGMLEAIVRGAGYRVGAYTSPHLVRYNERVRINGREANDAELCGAFERIERVRGEIPLTYFEFGTLAAFDLFHLAAVDIAVLEIGMGGRLDAVNAIDADVAVLTSVAIDHTQWLGHDRESIGREKAGIFRRDRPAVCADPDPPASVLETANRLGVELYRLGHDFFVEPGSDGTDATCGWTWRGRAGKSAAVRVRAGLPYPAMRGDFQLCNAAAALMALELMATDFPLTQSQVRDGLLGAVIPGRFQVLPGQPLRVLDVAHNPAAAAALAATLRKQPVAGRTRAVFGMLKDKDTVAVGEALRAVVDDWYVATLAVPRGASAAELARALQQAGVVAPVSTFDAVASAYAAAVRDATIADRIVVLGSFYTVGDIMRHLP